MEFWDAVVRCGTDFPRLFLPGGACKAHRLFDESLDLHELDDLIPAIKQVLSDNDFFYVECIVLRGMSFSQTARECGEHRSTVRAKYLRILQRLRTHPATLALAPPECRAKAA